jgi:hypothetical protein
MQTGAYYQAPLRTFTTFAAPVTNRLLVIPIFIPNQLTATSLNVRVNTVTTSGVARLGIYNNGSGGAPGSLLLDAGTISYSTNSTTHTITISQVLNIGWYWFGCVVQSGSSTWNGYENGANHGATSTQRSFSLGSSNATISYYVEGVSGVLPSTPTFIHSNLGSPMIQVGF